MDQLTNFDTAVWTNTEAIGYEVSLNGANGMVVAQTFVVQVAKKLRLSRRELTASGGVYTAKDRKWFIDAQDLPAGVVPKPADVVVDAAGSRWTVLEEMHQDLEQHYELTTRNLSLAWQLNDRINIERAAFSLDAAGAKVKTFPPAGGRNLYAQLACRVQPDDAEVADERGIRGTLVRAKIIVEKQLPLLDTFEDRVNWNGVYYDITRYENARQIGELPHLIVELRP